MAANSTANPAPATNTPMAMPHHRRVVKNLRISAVIAPPIRASPLRVLRMAASGAAAALRGCGCGSPALSVSVEEQRLEVASGGRAARGSADRRAGPRRRSEARSLGRRRAGRRPVGVTVTPAARQRAGQGGRGRRCATQAVGSPCSSADRALPTSRPLAMMTTSSTVCSTSCSMWLETRTVLPSSARWRRKPRSQRMPSGSRPLAGSSRMQHLRVAEQGGGEAEPLAHAHASSRRPACGRRPGCRRARASRRPARCGTPAVSARTRRWSRPLRPGWKLVASRAEPDDVTAGCGMSA